MRSIFIFLATLFLSSSVTAVAETLPPALFGMAHCTAVSNQSGAGQMTFEVYVGVNAGEQNGDLQNQPGAIVQTGVPFLGDTSVLFTNASISLVKSTRKFSVQIGTAPSAIALDVNLSETSGHVVGSGVADLGPRGSVPLSCSFPSLISLTN